MKLINTNRLRVRAMHARVAAGGAPLSRWETRFIANYKRDALKYALSLIPPPSIRPMRRDASRADLSIGSSRSHSS